MALQIYTDNKQNMPCNWMVYDSASSNLFLFPPLSTLFLQRVGASGRCTPPPSGKSYEDGVRIWLERIHHNLNVWRGSNIKSKSLYSLDWGWDDERQPTKHKLFTSWQKVVLWQISSHVCLLIKRKFQSKHHPPTMRNVFPYAYGN